MPKNEVNANAEAGIRDRAEPAVNLAKTRTELGLQSASLGFGFQLISVWTNTAIDDPATIEPNTIPTIQRVRRDSSCASCD